MTAGLASHAAYVPLERARPEVAGRPTIAALPVPRPYGDFGTIVKWKIDESFPDAVGGFIAWLLNESGRSNLIPVTHEQLRCSEEAGRLQSYGNPCAARSLSMLHH
jgi:hypothetical protein